MKQTQEKHDRARKPQAGKGHVECQLSVQSQWQYQEYFEESQEHKRTKGHGIAPPEGCPVEDEDAGVEHQQEACRPGKITPKNVDVIPEAGLTARPESTNVPPRLHWRVVMQIILPYCIPIRS